MRLVAGLTALGLDGNVFEHERALHLPMALETDRFLRRSGTQHMGLRRAVRIVTVAALNQPLIDTVTKWLAKLRLGDGVAAITEVGLFLFQKGTTLCRGVGRMAAQTTFAGIHVG